MFHRRSIVPMSGMLLSYFMFHVNFVMKGVSFLSGALPFVRVDLWCVVLHFYGGRSGFQMEEW